MVEVHNYKIKKRYERKNDHSLNVIFICPYL